MTRVVASNLRSPEFCCITYAEGVYGINLNLIFLCPFNAIYSACSISFHSIQFRKMPIIMWTANCEPKTANCGLTRCSTRQKLLKHCSRTKWAAPSEFGAYRLCEQRRFRRACASAQSRQNLRCSLIQAVNQEEPSDRKPDPWPL